MILIFSRQDDGSTSIVIEWLVSLNKKFIRLNADDKRTRFVHFDVTKNELIVDQQGQLVNLFDATSLWYRRKGFSIKSIPIDEKTYHQAVFPDATTFHQQHMQSELKVLIDYIHSSLADKCTTLGNNISSEVNKMKVLAIAQQHGLTIPESYIISSKAALVKILKEKKKGVVTKALGNGIYRFTKKTGYYSYTEKLTTENIAPLPDHFFPSLIQLEIKKKFELRVFYLKGDFYAMAIFSQHSKKTTVDFRRSAESKPNRTVPYKLPATVQQQLRLVMAELSLDTGSIDIIVDEKGDYVFLEVNPIGQFTMTSLPCNYYLEKKIAAIL
ncbi:grasp-with-spasm system ATP-grasp peptide maturase [Chitinophaga nivalis]|uniref:Grasp-with-spasm system ATP-grasp peptide maturase n=1 Tax=Chitinophaga nivalis TaxID=2991709 RepID=A0ABT3IJM7_9BACT|nr:grasp-with-spasm system ATP-grasp peptide maturase [Chitinophaga nivalis]MCW3466146.1 grasp-with-spasm system ATP-grasp peptide maturase [Chitinophaga nivalis]MCW3484163.1 grasp-with-spasm system ATP-grasp peptide maturase [Chitinophaga nivalis]